MTEKEARIELEYLLKLHQEINSLTAIKEDLYSSLYKSPEISNMPRTTSPDPKLVEKIYLKLSEQERIILQNIDRLADDKKRISERISKIEDPTLRAVLRYRYLMAWSWNKIQKVLNYHPNYLFELHRKAIKAYAKDLSKS